MKLKKIFSLALIACFTLGVTACGSTNKNDSESTSNKATQDNSKTNTIVYGIEGDPGDSINVITTGDRYGLMSIKLLYSPLYMFNGADKIEYFLAKSAIQSEDKLSINITLRDDVKWNDGEMFTADDVIFTYEQMLEEKNAGWARTQLIFNGIPIKLEKVSDFEVKFIFPSPSATEMESIANVFIMPKHVYQGVDNIETSDLNKKPVGTGPYMLSEYKAGESVKFVKNENYFLGTPKVDSVIYKIVGDPKTALLAVKTGEIDVLSIDPSDVTNLSDTSNVDVKSYTENRIGYLAFNLGSSNVQEKDVRVAILDSLDKDKIVSGTYLSEEYSYIAPSFLPRAATYFNEDTKGYSFDLEKSKELVASTGIGSQTFKLAYVSTNNAQKFQATIIQQQAKTAGINIELMPLEGQAISKKLQDGNTEFDMYLGGYIMGIDPDTFATLFVTDSDSNYMQYSNKEVDKLFEEGRIETDLAKRKEIYVQIQDLLSMDAVFYPMAENKRLIAINSKIAGIEEAGLVPVYTFEDMSKLYYK